MASSGTLYSGKFTSYDSLEFRWSIASQNKLDNYSMLNWEVWLISGAYGAIQSVASKEWRLTIDGATYTGKAFIDIGNNTSKKLSSGSVKIVHNADGTKSVAIGFVQNIDIYFNSKPIDNATIIGAIQLDTIVKTSTLLDNRWGYIGETTLIPVSMSNASNTHTLTFTYKSIKSKIAEKSGDTLVEWTIPTTYYVALTNNTYGNGTMQCDTYDSKGNLIGTETATYQLRINIEQNKPDVEFDYYENDIDVVGVGILDIVKNKSDLTYTVTATAKNSATIKSYRIECGKHLNTLSNTGTITDIDSKTCTVTVTDSRGIQTVETIDFSSYWIEYVEPTCRASITAPTPDEAGTVTIDVNGRWLDWLGNISNVLSLFYRYKVDNGGYTSDIPITAAITTTENTYFTNFTIDGFDYTRKYTFIITAQDELSTVESAPVVIKTQPVFDWSNTDFNFNVPVTINGKPIEPPADYIIEQGTEAMGSNGTWYWRKWKSGNSEAYGVRNYGNMAVTTAWGNLYRSQPFIQSLPDCFIQAPDVVNISIVNGNYGGWVAFHENTAATDLATSSFIVVRPASATISQVYLSFYVAGRWQY